MPSLPSETNAAVITKDDQPVARQAAANGGPLFGLLNDKMSIEPDFDEPLEEFRPYVECTRASSASFGAQLKRQVRRQLLFLGKHSVRI